MTRPVHSVVVPVRLDTTSAAPPAPKNTHTHLLLFVPGYPQTPSALRRGGSPPPARHTRPPSQPRVQPGHPLRVPPNGEGSGGEGQAPSPVHCPDRWCKPGPVRPEWGWASEADGGSAPCGTTPMIVPLPGAEQFLYRNGSLSHFLAGRVYPPPPPPARDIRRCRGQSRGWSRSPPYPPCPPPPPRKSREGRAQQEHSHTPDFRIPALGGLDFHPVPPAHFEADQEMVDAGVVIAQRPVLQHPLVTGPQFAFQQHLPLDAVLPRPLQAFDGLELHLLHGDEALCGMAWPQRPAGAVLPPPAPSRGDP